MFVEGSMFESHLEGPDLFNHLQVINCARQYHIDRVIGILLYGQASMTIDKREYSWPDYLVSIRFILIADDHLSNYSEAFEFVPHQEFGFMIGDVDNPIEGADGPSMEMRVNKDVYPNADEYLRALEKANPVDGIQMVEALGQSIEDMAIEKLDEDDSIDIDAINDGQWEGLD